LPKTALIFAPTFFEYERALKTCEGEPKFLFLKESQSFSVSIQRIIDQIKDVEAVFICNPNNPTGTFFPKDELLQILKITEERKIALIVDESYLDFKYPGESLVREAQETHHLLVLRSFTKFFAIAGLRLGYAVAGRYLIEKMAGLKEPWTVNCLAQAAGSYLLRNEEKIEKIREAVSKESEFLFGELSRIRGLKPYTPEANFILVKIETGPSSLKLQEDLARRGILIRDCSNFTGLGHKFFRVAVRKREENLRLIESLREVI
jgi:threonine-phosphate decarboxylase